MIATRAIICAALLLPFVGGCKPPTARLAGSRADSTVRELIARLAMRDTAGFVLPFDETALTAQGIDKDSLLQVLLPGFDIGRLRKAEIIDRAEFHPFNATRVDEQITYHVVGEQDSRIVLAAATTDSGRTKVTGIRWQQAPANLREMNAFTLSDKSWLHYLFLVLALLVPVFSVGTAVAAVLSRTRYKWLWAVASLVSIGKLAVVWSGSSAAEAVVRFSPINLQLFGAGVLKYPLYAPWVISIGFPVFALAYWIVGRRVARETAAAPSVAA